MKNIKFNTTKWHCFVAWFHNHAIISDKAWEIYDNSHVCSNTVRMSYIEYNSYIHKLKQEITKVI